jgi:hypothetical protein
VNTNLPIRLTLKLLDDDGVPRPGSVHATFADEAGQEHRLTVAQDANDVDRGQALYARSSPANWPSPHDTQERIEPDA